MSRLQRISVMKRSRAAGAENSHLKTAVLSLLAVCLFNAPTRGAYCDAWGNNYGYERISRVQVGDIDNATGGSNYTDYTNLSTTMEIGTGYQIIVTNYYPYDQYDYCGVWVDWNQDEDFDDAAETISVSPDQTTPGGGVITFAGTITPPAGAALGSTRMRVRILWKEAINPCGSTSYGEVEDYTITVLTSDNGIIRGRKFNDLDEDGNLDAGEPGIGGWEIYLDTNGNRQWDMGEPKSVTNGNGDYEFTGLAPGLYAVDEVHQAGWHQTHPGDEGRYTETIETDSILTDRDFGNRQISGTLISLQAIEDTYANSANPDTNYGSGNAITSGMSSGSIYRAFIKFDLSSIPPGQVVIGAKLRLENSFISIPAPQLDVFRASDRWDESTVTWNKQPGNASAPPIPINRSLVSGDETFWDVTEDVDTDYAVDGFYSVRIISSDEGLQQRASFWSKDLGWPPSAPTLEVEYEPIFGGGTGEPDDPYQIWTGEQFNAIGLYPSRWSKHYKLMADISLAEHTGNSYNRIGVSAPPTGSPFGGVFDGNFHRISDFSYFATSSHEDNYIGLFGYVYDATIRNLKVISPDIYTKYYSQSYVGPVAGYVDSANIAGCSVIGGSVDGQNYVGGLVELCKASFIASCSSSASVSGAYKVGGLVGGASTYAGFPNIADCYASGPVTGTDCVAGFIGDSSSTAIVNCYSTGPVNGTTNVGGFSGYHDPNWFPIRDHVVNCFWDVASSNTPNSPAATGLDTTAMQDVNTYLAVGWDFVGELANGGSDDWAMPPGGGYPVLWHELTPMPPLPTFAGGSGTVGNPYLIATADQLNSVGHNSRLMDKHFKLAADLDLEGSKYYVIAPRPYEFTGTFDGNDHAISNIQPDPLLNLSYFGFVCSITGAGASIRNLTLIDPNVVSVWGWGVGSLAGLSDGGSIINCHAVNANVQGLTAIGGLVGANIWYGKISGCSVTGNVSESLIFGPILGSSVAGLVGENSFWSEIEGSFTKCNVSGDDCVAGLVGTNVIYSTVTNCYSSGNVTGTTDYIGGLIGRNQGGTETNYCYSSCVVEGPEGTDAVGALVGRMGTGTSEKYTACFWDSQINGTLPGIGNATDPNVIGESTANMKTQSTFTNAGWDFVAETANGTEDIWDICEHTNYPKLAWQSMWGDLLCPDGVDLGDYSFFAERWLNSNCAASNDCDGTDLDLSGAVGWGDFRIFCQHWLEGF